MKTGRKTKGKGTNTMVKTAAPIIAIIGVGNKNNKFCCKSTYTRADIVNMCPVALKIKHGSSMVFETYALLDSCGQGIFVEKQLLGALQTPGTKTTFSVKTLNGEVTKLATVVEGLKGSLLGMKQFLTIEVL